VPLSRIFALFEDNKARMRVIEFSLSQMSLESVFNSMASHQEEEKGVVRGMMR
jgi:hypothetical protein